jgi:hypothetical protein
VKPSTIPWEKLLLRRASQENNMTLFSSKERWKQILPNSLFGGEVDFYYFIMEGRKVAI